MRNPFVAIIGPTQPKYRVYTRRVYPSQGDVAVASASQLPKLTFYALTNPQKLPHIGKFLNRKLERGLRWNRRSRVLVSMQILNALIGACHTELRLFSQYVYNMVKVMLANECSEYQMVAIVTLIDFLKYQEVENAAPLHSRQLEAFASSCLEMASSSDVEVRFAGLRGLRAILRVRGVGLQMLYERIVGTLLLAMRPVCVEGDELNEDGSADSGSSITADEGPEKPTVADVHALAVECMRQIISRTSSVIKTTLLPILEFFNEQDCWGHQEFPIEVLRMFTTQAQNAHIMVTSLVDQLDHQHSIEVKTHVVEVLFSLSQNFRGSGALFVLPVVDGLMRNLYDCVDEFGDSELSFNYGIESIPASPFSSRPGSPDSTGSVEIVEPIAQKPISPPILPVEEHIVTDEEMFKVSMEREPTIVDASPVARRRGRKGGLGAKRVVAKFDEVPKADSAFSIVQAAGSEKKSNALFEQQLTMSEQAQKAEISGYSRPVPAPPMSSTSRSSYSSTPAPSITAAADRETFAKFAGAKSISSAQFFGEDEEGSAPEPLHRSSGRDVSVLDGEAAELARNFAHTAREDLSVFKSYVVEGSQKLWDASSTFVNRALDEYRNEYG